MGVVVKGFEDRLSTTFRLDDHGAIISIKLSPDQNILAIQRAKSVVEFFNVSQIGPHGQLDTKSYEQPSRNKTSTTILGYVEKRNFFSDFQTVIVAVVNRFYWTSSVEIVYFTSHGIEVYNVLPEKRQVKSVRYLNQLISWFVFCPYSNIVVISMSKTTSSLFVFHLKNGTIYKLPKLEIDPHQQIEVKEKDVVVFTNYNVVNYVALVIHPDENAPASSSTSEIILYNINKDAVTVTKTHRLQTSFNGVSGLAMHTIDDVLLVHNKQEGETFFFDVGGLSGEFDGTLSHHVSVGKPCRMTAGQEYPNWVLFPPDIVIDPNAGTMSKITLKIEALKVDEDFCGSLELPRHVSFMLQRQNAKRALLESLLTCCVNPEEVDLTSLGTCFDRINR